jgi:hypothetical protein
MGMRARKAVTRLASEVGAELQKCWHSGWCGFEKLEARFSHRGYWTRIGAGSRVSIEMKGFETSVAFALGAADRVCLMNQPCEVPPLLEGLALFVNPNISGSTATDWLADDGNVRAVAALECSRREPLYVYQNAVIAVVKPARASVAVLSSLADVAERLEASPPAARSGRIVDGLHLNPDLLPADLRRLVPLIEIWAVGDDVEREQLLKEADRKEVNQLIEVVGPLLGRIDAYLSSFNQDELPEEAALVARLAEAVAESGGGKPPGD